MNYRWLTNEEIETLVNPVMKIRNWAELNINEQFPTCRVLGAFLDDGELIETLVMQMYPVLGPLVRINNELRDSGETSRRLSVIMEAFLTDTGARDFMAVANSPVTARLCERFGMKKLDVPVYVRKDGRS